MAAPGLLAHVIVGKYCDHLPLYRREQIYLRRHGVHLPRQTLARWMELAADCRHRGFDPYTYLREVLTRLPHLTNW